MAEEPSRPYRIPDKAGEEERRSAPGTTPPRQATQKGPARRQTKARQSEGKPTRTIWAQERPGRSMSVTRAKGSGRGEGGHEDAKPGTSDCRERAER